MTNEEWAMEIQAGRAGYGELWEQVRRFIGQQAVRCRALHPELCERAGVEREACSFLDRPRILRLFLCFSVQFRPSLSKKRPRGLAGVKRGYPIGLPV